jgi:hypothetical protein
MWQIKTFNTRKQMQNWVRTHSRTHQITEIFVNSPLTVIFAVEYRILRRIY